MNVKCDYDRLPLFGITNIKEQRYHQSKRVTWAVENTFSGYVDPAEIVAVDLVFPTDPRISEMKQIRIHLTSGGKVWDGVYGEEAEYGRMLLQERMDTIMKAVRGGRERRLLTPASSTSDVPLPPPYVDTRRIFKAEVLPTEYPTSDPIASMRTKYRAEREHYYDSEIVWIEHGLPRFKPGDEIQIVMIEVKRDA